MKDSHKVLLEDDLLTQEQFEFLDKIKSKQLFSLYFELRSMLYIGVLLLSTGIGFIIYQNMDAIGHFALITILVLLEVAVFWYIQKHMLPYTNDEHEAPTPYFDYVLLFGALLLISIFTYILIQFDLLESLLEWSSLISAIAFVYLAFRHDHRGVLTLGLTAFAAFWGLSVSPIQWAQNEFMDVFKLSFTGIVIGLLYVGSSFALDFKNIKKHFVFTFKNFGLLILFASLNANFFDNYNWGLYAFGSLVISIMIGITSWKKQEYLFFVYGAVFGYIAFTRIFMGAASDLSFEFWLMYTMASMGGFIWMVTSIISNKRKNRKS